MRRRRITKRELTPDVKYNSELVARLINTLMRNGKKTVAQSIVYGAFDVIKSKKKDMEPLDSWFFLCYPLLYILSCA